MTALDAILLGFEAELELERELGTRTIPLDRTLLSPPPTGCWPLAADRCPLPPSSPLPSSLFPLPSPPTYLFLHHRPLSPKATAMMERIYAALKLAPGSASVVTEGPVPAADKVVVLGGLALKKFLPGAQCQPGSWVKTPWPGGHALVTYSPEYILRFSEGSREQLAAKRQLWTALNSSPPSSP